MRSKISIKKYRCFKLDKYSQQRLRGLSERTRQNYPKGIGDWVYFVSMSSTDKIEKLSMEMVSELEEHIIFEYK